MHLIVFWKKQINYYYSERESTIIEGDGGTQTLKS